MQVLWRYTAFPSVTKLPPVVWHVYGNRVGVVFEILCEDKVQKWKMSDL